MLPAFLGIGKLIGIGASIFGGSSKKKAAKAQAKAAELNAQQVRERGQIEATLRERTGVREAGTIRAAAGHSGLAFGGSAQDILLESTRNTLFDLNTIRTQSELQAQVYEQEAKGARSAGRSAMIGGFLDAATILVD